MSDRFSLADFEYQLASAAYASPEQRQQRLHEKGYDVTFLDAFNNDEFYAVVAHHKVYNVHRGSVTTEDWLDSDKHIALDKLEKSDRYRRALLNSLGAREATELQSVEVGHSLGGTLAERIALHTGQRSVVFNQGTTPLANYHGIDRQLHQHFRVSGDGVSKFDPTATVVGNQTHTTIQDVVIQTVLPPGVNRIVPWLVGTAQHHGTSEFGGY